MDLVAFRPDLPLAGSPERSAWRSVVAAADGSRFVLERIASTAYDRKRRIAKTLQRLSGAGIEQVATPLPALDGDPLPLVDHALWQMTPYVEGLALVRPAYTLDAWRGAAAADFLIHLQAVSGPHVDAHPHFSIQTYIHQLFGTLSTANPRVAKQFRPFGDYLERHLFPVHDGLPAGFCHGDFHPLNIIWGAKTIRAVIDWEFCGSKPEIYDLANLLGCLGIEDPRSLEGPFAARLTERLGQAGIYAQRSWQALPAMVLAIRFAWLSEWLRKNDAEMIRMEADYMTWLAGGRFIFPANG